MEQSNKLLMHYGCQTALDAKLQTSLSLLLIELGMSFQALQLSYNEFEDMVATSWLKWVWERLDRFKFAVMVHNLRSVFPWEDNNWLMARFIAIGYKGNDLRTLNRVRKHQHVLFMSEDILGAGGKSLDKCYLQKQRGTHCWSTIKFSWDVVIEVEMHPCCMAVMQVVAAGLTRNRCCAEQLRSLFVVAFRTMFPLPCRSG